MQIKQWILIAGLAVMVPLMVACDNDTTNTGAPDNDKPDVIVNPPADGSDVIVNPPAATPPGSTPPADGTDVIVNPPAEKETE